MTTSNKTNTISVSLTVGAVRNGYISIPGDCSLFPSKYYGGEPDYEEAAEKFILRLPNGESVCTDIRVKDKNPSRAGRIRKRLGKFFKTANIKGGAVLTITSKSEGEYQLKITGEQTPHVNDESIELDRKGKLLNNLAEEAKVIDEVTLRAIKSRRGQVNFRSSLLTAFNDTCCITGCSVISVLEAAHIISHADETNYKVTNGLLLRADIHTLFDLNLIGIDQYGVVHLSKELENSEYSEYQGVIVANELPEETISNLQKRFLEYNEKNK